ncbi:MAG: trypsin-like peptidase domain-containing protein [Deltaproteobacteria bacterium]|nr:trypsin-like peptidase domain-containing protein [Deltaproteobacteria bacterium]MBI2182992.1 trypsin-like peptidase domain-containing protein [Deltaproteobacteria bacterium]MBI2364965.1 trypsin-like peptidase domain-containing protein [Deltaproteobacteria bacterium]
MSHQPQNEPGPRLKTIAWSVSALAVLAILLVKQSWLGGASLNDPRAAPRNIAARGELSAGEKSTIALFREASPSVVHITAIAVQRDLFTLNLYQIPEGTGSGFIWDNSGNIITNFHVIQNADAAQVTLADQSNWKARRVGVAPDKDLAVLRIDAPANKLRAIPVGTSKDLQVGQSVFAIGNPFGLDQSLTTGVISALGREIESVTRRPIQGVIQTDAAINPGNSGGPLLDSAGRLIGVNTAIYSPSGASAGIGFAIPVDTVNRIVPELIRSGKVTRPGMGIQIAEDQIAERLGVTGVLVVEVVQGSAAAKAGLRPTRREASGRVRLGDVITAIDGKKIESPNELFLILERYKVGDSVNVTLVREGKTVQAKVTLEAVQ